MENPKSETQKTEGQKEVIRVAAGIIYQHGAIFVTRRSESSHLAGFWEFPGGKLKGDETFEDALTRELKEEVEILPLHFKRLETIKYDYSDRMIELAVYFIEDWIGIPFAREGQESRWILCQALEIETFPPANRNVLEQLKRGDVISF